MAHGETADIENQGPLGRLIEIIDIVMNQTVRSLEGAVVLAVEIADNIDLVVLFANRSSGRIDRSSMSRANK